MILNSRPTLNMVRRNFTKGTTSQIRNQIFTGLVRPTLEYGCIVWDPHQTSRIQLLESVQNKGARYIMWCKTGIDTLRSHRWNYRLDGVPCKNADLLNSHFSTSLCTSIIDLSFHHMWWNPKGSPKTTTVIVSRTLEHRAINICTHSCLAPLGHGTSCHRI